VCSLCGCSPDTIPPSFYELWETLTFPLIKKIIIASLLCARGQIKYRDNSFESLFVLSLFFFFFLFFF
jgi:hypothetical protein